MSTFALLVFVGFITFSMSYFISHNGFGKGMNNLIGLYVVTTILALFLTILYRRPILLSADLVLIILSLGSLLSVHISLISLLILHRLKYNSWTREE